jgi:hypothetical protein
VESAKDFVYVELEHVDVDREYAKITWFSVPKKQQQRVYKITRFLIYATSQGILESQLCSDLQYRLPELRNRTGSWWKIWATAEQTQKLEEEQLERSWSKLDLTKAFYKLAPFFSAFGYTEEMLGFHTVDEAFQKLDRFQRLLHRLDGIIFSVSPFVKFPAPYLLKRMQHEDTTRKHRRTGSHASISSIEKPMINKTLMNNNTESSSGGAESKDENERYVLSLHDRESMKSIAFLDDSLDGVLSDQSFPCLFSIVVSDSPSLSFNEGDTQDVNGKVIRPPCLMKDLRLNFYDSRDDMFSDITLGRFLLDLVKDARDPCCRKSFACEKICQEPNWKHQFRFSSGQAKIIVEMEEIELGFENDFESNLTLGDVQITSRTYCSICDKAGPCNAMSTLGLKCSLGKFLELMCYNKLFTPHGVPLCRAPLDRWDPHFDYPPVQEQLAETDGVGSQTASTESKPGSKRKRHQSLRKFWPFKNSVTSGADGATTSSYGASTEILDNSKYSHFITEGACPIHRSSLYLEFTVHKFFKIKFRSENIGLQEVSLPSLSLRRNASVLSTENKGPEFAADGCGPFISPFIGISPLQLMVNSYFNGVFSFMDSLKSASVGSRSGLFKSNGSGEISEIEDFAALLLKERESIDKWLKEESSEFQSWSEISKCDSTRKLSIWSRYRSLRRDVHNKVIAIDREIAHSVEMLILKYKKSLPKYEPSFHPDSFWRRISPVLIDPDVPSSFIAFALSAWEVREWMGILEECAVEVEKIMESSKNTSKLDPLADRMAKMKELLQERNLPRFIESWSDDGLQYSHAFLVDGCHILYKFQKFQTTAAYEARHKRQPSEIYSELDEYNTASTVEESNDAPVLEFSVVIYFAYFFHLLRNKFNLALDDFVDSISCCHSWTPSGGKSDSPFYKTTDERFILKHFPAKKWLFSNGGSSSSSSSLAPFSGLKSNAIRKSFYGTMDEYNQAYEKDLSSISAIGKYLSYLLYETGNLGRTYGDTTHDDHSTLLVKILGEYRLVYKSQNNIENADNELDLVDTHFVIMENLFHGRRITHQFDLKGIRTRKAKDSTSVTNNFSPLLRMLSSSGFRGRAGPSVSSTSNEEKRTLLDGNFIQSIYSENGKNFLASQGDFDSISALSLHPHSRHLLFEALAKDTDFLARSNVVDYSLLIGIDPYRKELVVGLVDYLCEYTFWKKLENKGKTTLKVLEQTMKGAIKRESSPLLERVSNTDESLAASFDLDGHSFFELVNTNGNDDIDDIVSESVTIQPPLKYKERFLKSMELYFPYIPDKWTLK